MKKIAVVLVCILLAVNVVSCKKQTSRELPTWIQFYSFEGIREYVLEVKEERKSYHYDNSRITYNIFQKLSYGQAQKSVKDITQNVIPRVKEGVEIESFSANYYIGYKEPFQIKYQIDGELFVFTYSYDGGNVEYRGELICTSNIGSNTLNLY